MSESLFFTVPGTPRGKGIPRFSKKGNFVRTYTPEETARYENLIALAFADNLFSDDPIRTKRVRDVRRAKV